MPLNISFIYANDNSVVNITHSLCVSIQEYLVLMLHDLYFTCYMRFTPVSRHKVIIAINGRQKAKEQNVAHLQHSFALLQNTRRFNFH